MSQQVKKATKLKKISWKYFSRLNEYVGKVNGVENFFIHGIACLTRLNLCEDGTPFREPDRYSITSVENGRKIASDLLNGINLKEHDQNRLLWEAKSKASGELIKSTQELLDALNTENEKKIIEWTLKNVKDFGDVKDLTIEERVEKIADEYIEENHPNFHNQGALKSIYLDGVMSDAARIHWFNEFKK